MNLKNKLMIILILPYLIIGGIIILYFLNYNIKIDRDNKKLILNSQGDLLLELLRPYIINNQPEKIKKILNRSSYFKDTNILLKYNKIYYKGDKGEYKKALNLLKGDINKKKLKNYLYIIKPIKISYSDHVWGKILLLEKTPPALLYHSIIKNLRLSIFFIFLIIIFYILYISYLFSPLTQIKKDVLDIMKQKKDCLSPTKNKHDEFSTLVEVINNLIKENIKKQKLLMKKTNSLKSEVDRKTSKMVLLVKEQMKKTGELNKLQRDYYIAQKNSSLYSLMSGLAHEINNPLTMVVGNFEYLLYVKNVPADLKKWIKKKSKELFNIKEMLQKAIQVNTNELTSIFQLTDFINNFAKAQKNIEIFNCKKPIYIELPDSSINIELEFKDFFNTIQLTKPKEIKIIFKQKEKRISMYIIIDYNKYVDEIDFRMLLSKHIIILSSLGDINFEFKENKVKIILEIESLEGGKNEGNINNGKK
jgi:hypothetical protein